jgi:hypothetical protein
MSSCGMYVTYCVRGKYGKDQRKGNSAVISFIKQYKIKSTHSKLIYTTEEDERVVT